MPEPLVANPFAICEIALPGGGMLGLAPLPGRSGDLAADIVRIVAWAPRIVVSMTETSEMASLGGASLGGASLGAMLAAAGIRHACFPIRDFGAPEQADAGWSDLSTTLHALLDEGARALLHCLGGRGRSGMVALRLMSERGVDPANALEIIRAARPGAVETDAQVAWGIAGSADMRR